jgi:type VI protein secretion system component VasK
MARDKSKKGAATAASAPHLPSVSAHPLAKRSINRTKAWCGLLAFLFVAFLSYRAGVPAFEIGLRALVAGVIAYLVAWAVAVALWRRLILHELKVGTERRRVEQEEAAEKLRAEQEAAAAAEDEEVVA